MPRTLLLLYALLCCLTGAMGQHHADTVTRLIQGHWMRSILENGEAKPLTHEWGSDMYSIEVGSQTFTSIEYDPCSGMTSKSTCTWKYHEEGNTLEVTSEAYPGVHYYELLQLSEITLYLRRIYLPEGSEDVYGLVYRRVSIPPQIGKQ